MRNHLADDPGENIENILLQWQNVLLFIGKHSHETNEPGAIDQANAGNGPPMQTSGHFLFPPRHSNEMQMT